MFNPSQLHPSLIDPTVIRSCSFSVPASFLKKVPPLKNAKLGSTSPEHPTARQPASSACALIKTRRH